jgi:hypothetical protein
MARMKCQRQSRTSADGAVHQGLWYHKLSRSLRRQGSLCDRLRAFAGIEGPGAGGSSGLLPHC